MIEPKEVSSQSAQLLFDAFNRLDADVEVISKKFNLFQVSTQGQSGPKFYIKSTSLPVNPQPACLIANNKFLTKKVLRKNGIRTPKSILANSLKEAKTIIKSKNFFPCVIKPTFGAHGNEVYPNIESIDELIEILHEVFSVNKKREILIEEHITGDDYRVLVVGNKVSAVINRVPAHVIGDGSNNIKQLISIFNKHPLVGEKYEKPMCKIIIDNEVMRALEKMKLKITYVPKKGETIFLRKNANISTGGIGIDATKTVPESVKKIAIKAAKAINMEVTGVDVLYDPKTKKGYVLELNDKPGIDIHHYPGSGSSQNVAKDIATFIFNNKLESINS